MTYIYFFIFLFGLSLGSFMSVIVSRLNVKEGIISGRSECPKCLAKLKWYDLIPVLSFLILKGRCRYCGDKISVYYPTMEFAVAISFALYYWSHGPILGLVNLYDVTVIFLLLSLVFFDMFYLILPDKIIFPIVGLSIVYGGFYRQESLASLFISGFLFALFFAIIYLVSHGRAMGFGDVKLAFAIGLVLGYPLGFFSIISAIWLASLWGIGLILAKEANLKTALPFGSFLSATAIIFIIFKNEIEKINILKIFF